MADSLAILSTILIVNYNIKTTNIKNVNAYATRPDATHAYADDDDDADVFQF
jgi:hypothetical protein